MHELIENNILAKYHRMSCGLCSIQSSYSHFSRRLSCGHRFHVFCIEDVLAITPQCPTCGTEAQPYVTWLSTLRLTLTTGNKTESEFIEFLCGGILSSFNLWDAVLLNSPYFAAVEVGYSYHVLALMAELGLKPSKQEQEEYSDIIYSPCRRSIDRLPLSYPPRVRDQQLIVCLPNFELFRSIIPYCVRDQIPRTMLYLIRTGNIDAIEVMLQHQSLVWWLPLGYRKQSIRTPELNTSVAKLLLPYLR